jgi:hypothetical protein
MPSSWSFPPKLKRVRTGLTPPAALAPQEIKDLKDFIDKQLPPQ